MNLPFYIAWRYFFSKKKISYVHLLSFITQIGIAIGTAALVIVLSVFNGFENLVLSMYNVFDPHLKISSSQGKTFNRKEVNELLLKNNQIAVFSSTLEEKALVEYNSKQHIANIKGVDSMYNSLTNFDSVIITGSYIDEYKNANVAVIGRGVAYFLSMNIGSVFDNIQIYLPNRNSSNLLEIDKAFTSSSVSPVGVFGIQQEIDSEYIITPLNFAQSLIKKENHVSAIEIRLFDKSKILEVQEDLKNKLGKDYLIQNQYQQQEFLYKILNTEKLIVLLILLFIVLISSFNIISSLTVLILDKKKDVKNLFNIGLDIISTRKVFIYKSMLGIFFGSFLGLLIGFSIAFLQQEFGFIKMGEGSFVIDVYPVKLLFIDLILIQSLVLVIGFLASWITAKVMLKSA